MDVLTIEGAWHTSRYRPVFTNEEAFDAMANRQCRQLLIHLLHDDPQPVPRLSGTSRELLEASEAFLREYLSGSREIDDADKADVRTHHVHLPKLTEYSYVEWHRDARLTTRGSAFDEVRPLVELADEERADAPADGVSVIVRE